jgi:hypothetical protein
MVLHNGSIIRSPHTIRRAGTPAGDQKLDEFAASMLDVMGTPELLWTPQMGDTTSATELSRNADIITWDATVASRLGTLGSGLRQNFDAVDDEGDLLDSADHSFGDGAVDEAFSVFALVEADDATPTADANILTRWNEDSDAELREWRFNLSSTNGYPRLLLYDESANAFIGREDQTALTVDTWTFICVTYDGSGASTGIRIYVNAARTDDANVNNGTYVAMEDLNTVLSIGHSLSAAASPVAEEFWDGDMALIGLCRKELTIDEIWMMKSFINGHFDLTL